MNDNEVIKELYNVSHTGIVDFKTKDPRSEKERFFEALDEWFASGGNSE